MSEKNRTDLKSYFNTGDRPTESQFTDLIDSFVNKQEDNYVQSVPNASTTEKGIAERATVSEAVSGVDDTRFVTPKGLKTALNSNATEDTNWVEIALFNGVADSMSLLAWRKYGKIVYLQGLITQAIENQPLFELPLGPQYANELYFPVLSTEGVATFISLNYDGKITPSNLDSNGTVNLTGVFFFVE